MTNPPTGTLELSTAAAIADIEEQEWTELLQGDPDPFLRWSFLEALESTGCVSPERGWWPCHLTARLDGRLVAASPAYVKQDGMGDFSRDWGVSHLVEQLGARLYPKLVLGIPFSPVNGRRLLAAPEVEPAMAASWLVGLAREAAAQLDLGCVQVLYHTAEEGDDLERLGFAPRTLVQYHWRNYGYQTPEDWLARLRSSKRKQARRERREPERQGITLRTVRGDELREDARRYADDSFALYKRNSEKHYWGGAYLNRELFRRLFEQQPEIVEHVRAELDGRLVAGSVCLASDEKLYGRYWGCFEEHRFLHFNVCLYHSIDQCIARGRQLFEGGAGGEHKVARGFEPSPAHCSIWVPEQAVHGPLRRVLRQDSEQHLRAVDLWLQEHGLDRPERREGR